MKLSLCLLGLVAAVAPPTTELELDESSRLFKHRYSKYHKTTATQPNGRAVFGRQDYTAYCQANKAHNNINCKLPKARAFDHADKKQVTVRTSLYLVDLDKKITNKKLFACKGCSTATVSKKVKWTKRSSYLFKFDATDRAGNHAEQVVFGLILTDKVAPKISCPQGARQTVEAASGYLVPKKCGVLPKRNWNYAKQSGWKLAACIPTDNIDSTKSMTVLYTITRNNKFLVRNAPYRKAVSAIDTRRKGEFIVKTSVHDFAGKYGKNGKNNYAFKTQVVIVRDTQKPHIKLHGDSPHRHECATKYLDGPKGAGGAKVHDALDTCANKDYLALQTDNQVKEKVVGDYKVFYNGKDKTGNKAPQIFRQVQVRDATKPKIWRLGRAYEVHYSGGFKHQGGDHKNGNNLVNGIGCTYKNGHCGTDKGVKVWDSCDKKLPTKFNTPEWKPKKTSSLTRAWKPRFNDRKLGTYVRTYTVKDASGNTKSTTFTVKIEDDDQPMIKVKGKEIMTFEATRDQEYKDQGAICTDYVDGNIGGVVSSGDLVDLADAGKCGQGCKKYTIYYDCQDTSGNKADQLKREVWVCDRTKPRLTLLGARKYYVEAGFPYVDAGATATDTLDGDLTKKIFTRGDTVNVKNAFYHRRSCMDIKIESKKPLKNGNYYITTLTAAKAWARREVYCNMSDKKAVTYYKCLNCARVRPYSNQHGSCSGRGFEMLKFTSGAHKSAALKLFGRKWIPANRNARTDDYLCSTNDQNMNQANWPEFDRSAKYLDAKHDDISRKEHGKYVISYHVKDCAGNREAKALYRTVTVKDTLPPVITLTLKNKLIHTSYTGSKTPKHFQKVYINPAGQKFKIKKGSSLFGLVKHGNTYLMAEAATSNAWIVGAIASAVAGVALLASSGKKATSVPV